VLKEGFPFLLIGNGAATFANEPPEQFPATFRRGPATGHAKGMDVERRDDTPLSGLRLPFAVLIPFVAFGVQWMFWAAIKPYVWFLFFPAVFFSSWVGGLRGGLVATAASVLLVLYFFIPPTRSFIPDNPFSFVSIAVFLMLGVLFSISHERLRRANKRASDALRAAQSANALLSEANDKVTHLYKRTMELDELKSQLFANISHELRTPLTLILGPLEKMLGNTHFPEEFRRDLSTVQRSARLLFRHVTDLLDVAKLEAGRMTLHYAQVDLVPLTKVLASLFESHAMDTRLTFTVSLPQELPAQVDVEKLQRVLVNLLSNAFKFAPPDGAVELSLSREDECAVFKVRDNGPGVPEGMRSAVFERFRQVEGSATRTHGGTGLGLAIVKEFAELHKGTVQVSGAGDKGALFTVRIPLEAPPGTVIETNPVHIDGNITAQAMDGFAQDRATPAPDTGQASFCPAGDNGLVLVVEDNPDMNAFIRETLSPHWKVICAFDGQQGLDMAWKYHPDIIISDVMMPRFTGDQMALELRRHHEMDNVPIIMLTAKMDEGLSLSLLKIGVQDYITKPFSSDVLLARIQSCLKERRRHAAELLENQKRFQATFELAAVGIAQVAIDGHWLMVNQKLCDIVGYSLTELLTMSFQDITHPGDLQTDLQQLQKLLAGDVKTYSLEKRYIRKDGGVIWINLTVTLVRDEKGKPEYFISVVEDIQARKDFETALVASEERFRTLVDNTPYAVLVMVDGHIAFANGPAAQLLDLPSPDYSIGDDIMIYVQLDDHERFKEHMGQAEKSGARMHQEEFRLLSCHGQVLEVESCAAPLRFSNKDAILIFAHDIRRRKQAENEIKGSLREKELLLKEIHHRVKNNLQIITSLISLQCTGISNPGEIERAQRLEWRIRSMALIHEQLYGAGNFASIDMAEYIKNLSGRLASSFSGSAGKVQLVIDASPTPMGIDKAVPCGLLVNELITNAYKHVFNTNGEGRLDISLHWDAGLVTLMVRDNGPCFPEGFDFGNSNTLGGQLIIELTRQLGGKLNLACTPGAQIEVTFPLPGPRLVDLL